MHLPRSAQGQWVCAPSEGPWWLSWCRQLRSRSVQASRSGNHLERKYVDTCGCPILTRPSRVRMQMASALSTFPTHHIAGVSGCSPPPKLPSKRLVGQHSLAWSVQLDEKTSSSRWWWSQEPSSSLGTGFRCFPGNLNPRVSSGSISLLQREPTRKRVCQMALPVFLGSTHPELVHVCVHAHTHTHAHTHAH